MVKIELPENRRLQVGPTGSVVLVSCGEGEEANMRAREGQGSEDKGVFWPPGM